MLGIPVEILVMAAVALTGSAIQSTLGFGFVLFLAPVAFIFRPPQEAVIAMLVLSIGLNLLMLFGEQRRPVAKWRVVVPLSVGALAGLPLGVWLIHELDKEALQVALGAGICLAAIARNERVRVGNRTGLLMGVGAGALTTATGVNGPPLVPWLRARLDDPAQLRDTLTGILLFLNITGGIALASASGGHNTAGAQLAAVLFVPMVLGHRAGKSVFDRLDTRLFERLVVVGLVVAGLSTAAAGTW